MTILITYAFSDTDLKADVALKQKQTGPPMCIHPTILPEIGPVGCRICWQCLENRKNDYIGRCIAEQEHSDGVLVVSLTYGGGDNNPNAALLVYKDFQDFMKRLRIQGQRAEPAKRYTVRYIVAGEYGSANGRAHWHAVLFFKGYTPEVEIEQDKYSWSPWPHGYSYFQEPDFHGFAYVLKYALKDLKKENQEVFVGHMGRSLKPPLGAQYFHELAGRYVQQNIAPQDYFYSFPHVFDANRKRRVFMMQGAVQELFIQSFFDQYEKQRGEKYPLSETLQNHIDASVDLLAERTDVQWIKEFQTTHSGKAKPIPRVEFDDMDHVHDNSLYWQGTYRGLPVAVCEYPDGRLHVKNERKELWLVHDAETKQAFLKGFHKKTPIYQKAFQRFQG